jgi:membrane protease YdiL (CAAX protease family)
MNHLIWALPVLYFGVAWFFPWSHFQWESSISVSYVFDIVFVIALTIGFRLFQFKLFLHPRGLIARTIAIIGIALFSLFMVNLFGLKAPFKYVENLVLQILILAPIIEELIFRHVFYGVFEKYFINSKYNLILNSALFSLSHLPAIWMIPEEFSSFIIAQLVYTFVLGWMCTKSRMKSRAVFEPIFLHFVFNFIFYLAVIKGMI